jgi:acetyl-CoA carboxylase biotin carboxylase subunit
MFSKILIANRNEIALRVIKTCKEMGIKTVAVYSTADSNALHVKLADESICIGPPNPKDSYLNFAAIISAAEITDADAIHPGYGFLAENPDFAEMCENCGIKFIGPTSENIRLFGNKLKAKEIFENAGVPVIPGSKKELKDEKEALEIANEIEFPIIIKSASGGGGRGMRIVHSPVNLSHSFLSAQTESISAFGKSELYIEKYFEDAKHIEFQIMADEYGNIIHMGERDCSIQRHYQKITEEAPSTILSSKSREKIGKLIVSAIKSTGYNNVGTIEFLVDSNNNFYFIEMNTRIQVEHPVTEEITGINIIKEQIRLAAGKRLRFKQRDIKFSGHSIECRINAEDPLTFTPSPGRITGYHVPTGFGVRVDSALYEQYIIPPYYDSLIAKLIVHDETREDAIKKMIVSLDEYVIEGIKTNIPFHKKILNDVDFIKGEVSTNFLSKFIK